MKIHQFSFLFLVLWQMNFRINAEDTNTFYVTDTNPEKVDAVTSAKESLPAKDFPEGNWGEPVRGIQLSLRFDKQIYTNGEPITATLLMRNIVTNSMIVPDFNAAHNYVGGGGPVGLVMISTGGQPLIPLQANPTGPGRVTMIGGEVNTINPNTQRKFLERLDKMYDLTNGTYLIHARINLPFAIIVDGKPVKADWVEAKSADVQIKIEGEPADSQK